MHLLDTDIATLAYYGKNQNVTAKYTHFAKAGEVAICVVTRAEMLRGRIESLMKADSGEQWILARSYLKRTETWLNGIEIIDLVGAPILFDRLRQNKKHRFKGGLTDLMTACIALANNATLVTRNVKDYQGIPNLKIENWAA